MEALDKKIAEENALKLEVLKVQVEQELNQEKQALTRDCREEIFLMEKNYQTNHVALADKIVKEIINS